MTNQCEACRHCEGDPANLERLLPGLNSLSSAYGTSRGDTALCRFHNVFMRPGPACPDFDARQASAAVQQFH